MEKVEAVNPQRILWCCHELDLSIEQLAQEVDIAPATLQDVVQGQAALTVNQLLKLAEFFGRGMLFFLEQQAVREEDIHSPQFRTIGSQKPTLGRKTKSLIERVDRQRQVYISLLEELAEPTDVGWYPIHLKANAKRIKPTSAAVRDWLGLHEKTDFDQLRRAVEARNILVFVSNGYKGQWQINKTEPIRGFSLYYDAYPVIAIKKQESDGAQAFTLMHELGHLLLHGDSHIDDEDDFHSYSGKEQEANQFAGNLLVPDSLLDAIDVEEIPADAKACDNYLKAYTKRWCVSTEVILRRLVDEGKLAKRYYQSYRSWKDSLPTPKPSGGGSRYRYREPAKIFGEPFVDVVLDALHGQHITLTKASAYLDSLKIRDLRKLEDTHAHV